MSAPRLRRWLVPAVFTLLAAALIAVFVVRSRVHSPERLFQQGLDALDKKDYAHAITCFSEVIRLRPGTVDAYFNRGLAYMGRNEYLNSRRSGLGLVGAPLKLIGFINVRLGKCPNIAPESVAAPNRRLQNLLSRFQRVVGGNHETDLKLHREGECPRVNVEVPGQRPHLLAGQAAAALEHGRDRRIGDASLLGDFGLSHLTHVDQMPQQLGVRQRLHRVGLVLVLLDEVAEHVEVALLNLGETISIQERVDYLDGSVQLPVGTERQERETLDQFQVGRQRAPFDGLRRHALSLPSISRRHTPCASERAGHRPSRGCSESRR